MDNMEKSLQRLQKREGILDRLINGMSPLTATENKQGKLIRFLFNNRFSIEEGCPDGIS